jgi:hypothetical protein
MSVLTEPQFFFDSPQMKKGDRVILFLSQDKIYGDKPSGNDYAVVNNLQGEYYVDKDTGLIDGFDFANGTLTDFETKIANAAAASSPTSNSTQNATLLSIN